MLMERMNKNFAIIIIIISSPFKKCVFSIKSCRFKMKPMRKRWTFKLKRMWNVWHKKKLMKWDFYHLVINDNDMLNCLLLHNMS
jgi:hypothetical protein